MSRIIDILSAIRNGETYDAPAMSRAESILQSIANGTAYTDAPMSRFEELLLAIKNRQTASGTPQSRIEEILSAIANGTLDEYLMSESLTKYPYVNTSKTVMGIAFTDNEDGTVSINGTATNYASFIVSENVNFENNMTYLIAPYVVVQYKDNGEAKWARNGCVKWQASFEFVNAYIQIDKGETVTNLICTPYIVDIKSELEEALIATADKLKGE